jgi:hypothetical protein
VYPPPEIVRQKDFVHQSESILKRQLGYTTKALSRKAQLATDDNITLIQCVLLHQNATASFFISVHACFVAFRHSLRYRLLVCLLGIG